MNRIKKVMIAGVCVILVCLIVFCCVNKISQRINEISLVNKSAVMFVENEYPGYEFRIVDIKRTGNNYYIDLKVNDDKYSLVNIKCCVIPTLIENGYYYVKIWSTRNIDFLRRDA